MLNRTAGVLVPVKAFSLAKQRLAPKLSQPERALLSQLMAEHVIQAAQPLPTFVVCEAYEVIQWAKKLGVPVINNPGVGLNAAVQKGVDHLRELGFERAVIVHADIPGAKDFDRLANPQADIVIVPDHKMGGTNVLSIPLSDCEFEFAYGKQSFTHHLAEAKKHRTDVEVWQNKELARDVDWPEDLSDALAEWVAKAQATKATSAQGNQTQATQT